MRVFSSMDDAAAKAARSKQIVVVAIDPWHCETRNRSPRSDAVVGEDTFRFTHVIARFPRFALVLMDGNDGRPSLPKSELSYHTPLSALRCQSRRLFARLLLLYSLLLRGSVQPLFPPSTRSADMPQTTQLSHFFCI